MRHKHYDLIVAWADGEQIEVKSPSGEWIPVEIYWKSIESPVWYECMEYRIKPEPKPDAVVYWLVKKDSVTYFNDAHYEKNLKLTFDSDSGNLKSAEVIK